MWNVKLSIYNVFQPDALNPSSARLSENQAVMCIGCIVSALTRTFEWKMALLSRITAVLYSTPSSLFDHAVCSSFFLFFSFFRSKIRLFPRLSLFYVEKFPPSCLFFIPFDGARLVPRFENWKSLEGFFVNLEWEISWIVFEGVQENLKLLRNENLSELNDEAVFFWQRIKRWSQFHEYLRNKRFGKKKKKKKRSRGKW